MVKTLTKVGNSKALIIPADVAITDFQKAVNELRERKREVYERIESQANDPETIGYFSRWEKDFSDIDLDMVEE